MKKNLRYIISFHSLYVSFWLLTFISFKSFGQISITGPGFTYNQNFNTLPIAGSSNTWTDDSTLSNWYANLTTIIASTGTSTTGGLYSFGATMDTERALGALSSGSASPIFGVLFQNTSGAPIPLSSILISYTGEQWRQTTNAQILTFAYMTNSSIITVVEGGTWVGNTNLNFTAPQTGTAGMLNGNLAANQISFSNVPLAALGNLAPGHYLMLRWSKGGTTSPGLAVDDFSLTIMQLPNNPDSFTATTVSMTEISLSATANGDDDEIVVAFNTSNSFGTPVSNTTYMPGDMIGSAQVFYVGPAAGLGAHAGLDPGTTYYYRAWSVNEDGDFSSGANAQSRTVSAIVLLDYNEEFNTDPFLNGWLQYSVSGAQVWGHNAMFNNVQMNAFESGNCNDNEDWLITPPFDLSMSVNELLTFELSRNFPGTNPLAVLYSTDYPGFGDPGLFSWILIDAFDPSDYTANQNISFGPYNDLDGVNDIVYVAFRFFIEDADDCALWRVESFDLYEFQCLPPTIENIESCDSEGTIIDLSDQIVFLGDPVSVGYNFTDNSPVAAESHPLLLTGVDATRGSGVGGDVYVLGCGGGTGNGALSGTTWNVEELELAIVGNKYFEFIISNESATRELQVTSFQFDNRASNSGPTNWALLNGTVETGFAGSTNISATATACVTNQTTSLNIVIPPAQSIPLRIYAWGASTTGGTWRIDNVLISGISGCPGSAFNIYDDDPEDGGTLIDGAEEVTIFDPGLNPGESRTVWITRVCYIDCDQFDDPYESSAVEVTITYNESPEADISATSMLACEGEDIMLMAAGNGITMYQWAGPDGFTSLEQNPMIMNTNFMNAGTYYLTVTNAVTCTDTDSIDIEVLRKPLPPQVSDFAFCMEDERLVDLTSLTEFEEEVVVVEYDYNNQTPEGTSTNPSVLTGGPTTLGAGIVIPEANPNGFAAGCPSGMGGTNFAITSSGWNVVSLQDAIDNDKYFEFILTNPSATDIVRLTQFSFNNERSGSGPTSWALHYGMNPTGNSGSTSTNCGLNNFAISLEIYPGESLPLRLYAWDASASTGTWRIDNVIINAIYGGSDYTFNFYDEDPSMGAMPIASDVLSFEPMNPGIYWATSLKQSFCESEAVPFEVFFSEGRQNLTCISHVNVGLNENCELELHPLMFASSPIVPAFVSVHIRDQKGNIIPEGPIDASYVGQTLEFILTDDCFNNTCWGNITIEDKLPPTIFARDITIDCGDDSSPEALNSIEITDCSPFDVTIRDIELGDLCRGDRRIERTIIAIDTFGNRSESVQIISIAPIPLGAVTPPNAQVTTSCGLISPEDILAHTGNVEDAYPTIDGKPVIPNTYCNLVLKYDDHIIETCVAGCSTTSVKVTRTWILIDWCNPGQGIVQFDQIISAKDTIPPVILSASIHPVILDTDPWTCTAAHTFIPPNATDDCSDDDHIVFRLSGPQGITIHGHTASNIPLGNHEFFWTAEDCCGNLSDPVAFVVQVIDRTPPVAISLENIVIALVYDEPSFDAFATLYAKDVDNGSFDLCGPVTLRVRRPTDPCRTRSNLYTESVTFCCRDLNRVHEVELEVTDAYGNTNITWANVRVEAKTEDIVFECHDISVGCHEDIEFAISLNRPFAFFETCFQPAFVIDLGRDESHYNKACNSGYIDVIYGIEGYPQFTCTQRVNIEYKGDFTCSSIHWPEEQVIITECRDLPTFELTWDFGPCDLLGWTLQSDTFYFATDACAKIINTYTVIDWCAYEAYVEKSGYAGHFENAGLICNHPDNADERSPTGVYTFVEIIKLIDTIPPQLLVCENPRFPIRDQCSRTVTLQNFTDDQSDCPNLIVRYELTVITEDGEKFVYNTTKRPGEIASFRLTDANGNDIYFKGNTTHTAQWKVWDGCGNVSSCTIEFSIIDDKAPTPYCIGVSTALMLDGTVELWAVDFDRGSFDNCDNSTLYYTFENISPDPEYLDKLHYFNASGRIINQNTALELYRSGLAQLWIPEKNSSGKVFTCSDLTGDPLRVRITVWDNTFNSDFCIVELILSDNNNVCSLEEGALIAGRILTADMRPVSGAMVAVEKTGEGIKETIFTGADGQYAFPPMPVFGAYKIVASREDDPLNGINTLDILLIQRHILGITFFDNPYKLIAADVNLDRVISVQDITLLQRLILGLDKNLPSGAWKFIDSSKELFPETALSEYNTYREIMDLESNRMSEDFVGVKMGDVDFSAIVSLQDRQVNVRTTPQKIRVKDQPVTKGSYLEIALEWDIEDAYGYQFHLEANGLNIFDYSIQEPEGAHYMVKSETGHFYISYARTHLPIQKKMIINLHAEVLRSGQLSEMLALGTGINGYVYAGNPLQADNLLISFYQNENAPAEFIVRQNQPNPFDHITIIPVELPEQGQVKLKIWDIFGKMVHHELKDCTEGLNSLELERNSLRLSAGVYLYQIEYKNESVSKKMIVID